MSPSLPRFTRSDLDDERVLVDDAEAEVRGRGRWPGVECRSQSSSAGRRLRDRLYDGDLAGNVGDLVAPDMGHALRHREDFDAGSVWEEADAGPPGPPFQASPSLLGGCG